MPRSKESKIVPAIKANDASELEIVRRAQSGDRSAFDLLIFKYQSRAMITRH